MKKKLKNKKVKFTILSISNGWLDFKIKVGKKSFNGSFSAVYDPLLELKKWLTDICDNEKFYTSFSYFNELEAVRFTFVDKISSEEFIISDAQKVDKIYLKAKVDKFNLISAFYTEIVNYISSEKYHPEQWEKIFVADKITELLNTTSSKMAVDALLNMKPEQVKEVFFVADPFYAFNTKNGKKVNKYFKEFLFGDLNFKKHKVIFERVDDFPKKYKKANRKTRKKIIKKLMRRLLVSSYDAQNPEKFRSKKIEKCIKKVN